jgi:hypothetical protein
VFSGVNRSHLNVRDFSLGKRDVRVKTCRYARGPRAGKFRSAILERMNSIQGTQNALVVAFLILAALPAALPLAATAASHDERLLIPCQHASGPFVIVSAASAYDRLCDAVWMKDAKAVRCPSNLERRRALCLLHPDGTGVGTFQVAHLGVVRNVAVWCSAARMGASIACDDPAKLTDEGFAPSVTPGSSLAKQCTKTVLTVQNDGVFSTVTVRSVPQARPAPLGTPNGTMPAPMPGQVATAPEPVTFSYRAPNAPNGKPIIPVPTPGPCADATTRLDH